MASAPVHPNVAARANFQEAGSSIDDHSSLPSPTDHDFESWSTYSSSSAEARMSSEPSLGSQLPPLAPVQSENIKKCWICYEDSSDDNPNKPPRWRSPCPCSLVAHENCLLEWIADKELTRGSVVGSNQKFQCPQCEAEIKLIRPTSLFLTLMRRGDRLASQLALPASAALLVGSVMIGAYHHGLWSVRLLFGREDAAYVLRDLQRYHGWRLTYAFIPAALLLSRTEADFAVPIFELFVVFRHFPQYMTMQRVPPVVNQLVYFSLLRHAYNYSYSWVARKLQQRWMADIREQNEPGAVEEGHDDLDEGQQGGFELGINIEIGLGQEAADEVVDEEDDADLPEQPPPHDWANGPPPAIVARPDPPRQRDPPEEQPLPRVGNQIIIGTASILRTLVGALVFPAIASGMGALLRLALPSSLAQSRSQFIFLGSPNPLNRGILRSQWGQSLIGGCLFVVLKDVTVLFTQWRLAKNFRDRRVLDWVGTRGRDADGEYVLRN